MFSPDIWREGQSHEKHFGLQDLTVLLSILHLLLKKTHFIVSSLLTAFPCIFSERDQGTRNLHRETRGRNLDAVKGIEIPQCKLLHPSAISTTSYHGIVSYTPHTQDVVLNYSGFRQILYLSNDFVYTQCCILHNTVSQTRGFHVIKQTLLLYKATNCLNRSK